MKACGSCGAWIPDDAASCPNCGRATGTAAPPPPAPAPPLPPPSANGGPPDLGGAERRLRTLGTLYMAAGFLTLGFVALSFVQNASGATLEALDRLERQPGPFGPDLVREWRHLLLQPWYLAVTHAVPFLFGVFWAWSGSRLRALEGRGPALAAAALLCLPCAGCCCLNLPLGIYALVTLTRADSEAVLAARS